MSSSSSQIIIVVGVATSVAAGYLFLRRLLNSGDNRFVRIYRIWRESPHLSVQSAENARVDVEILLFLLLRRSRARPLLPDLLDDIESASTLYNFLTLLLLVGLWIRA